MERKKKEGIGLDIGSSAVKLVLLSRSGTKVKLTQYGIRELSPEAIVGGEIIDRELVVKAISDITTELKLSGRSVVTALSGREVIVKRINIEKVTKDALKEAVLWAAEEHIPYDIHDVAIDFQVLKAGGKSKTIEVLLIAVRREAVLNLSELVREAGVGTSVVDINPFAALNWVLYSEEVSKNETFATIDIGAESTCITISRESEPFLTWQVSVGTRSLTQALQKSFGVSHPEAIKILLGEDGKDNDQVLQLISPGFEEISSSLERGISYLADTAISEKLDRIFLCGGGSSSLGLRELFSKRFPGLVKTADVIGRVGDAPPLLGARLAVAMGLALREVG